MKEVKPSRKSMMSYTLLVILLGIWAWATLNFTKRLEPKTT